MTKEELEKEAEVYFKSICGDYNEEYERTGKRHYFVGFDIKNGYLAGAEPREKRIAELEKRCANYEMKISKMEKGTCDVCKETEKDKKIVELETRCNELFLQTCEQAEKIKELKAEIENDRDLPAIAYMQGAEKQKKKDEEELKKWKDEWQEQVQKANDEGYARTLQTIQLSKAKELLKQWLQTSKASGCDNINIVTDTEQFLKDSEVEK